MDRAARAHLLAAETTDAFFQVEMGKTAGGGDRPGGTYFSAPAASGAGGTAERRAAEGPSPDQLAQRPRAGHAQRPARIRAGQGRETEPLHVKILQPASQDLRFGIEDDSHPSSLLDRPELVGRPADEPARGGIQRKGVGGGEYAADMARRPGTRSVPFHGRNGVQNIQRRPRPAFYLSLIHI